MKGNIVELKFWRQEWCVQVHDWYESGEYAAFFRTLPNPIYREAFVNFPQLMGSFVLGIFAEKIDGLVGIVTVYEWDPNSRVASAGLLVDKKYQKMGIGNDAFLAIMKHLFEVKNLRKVSIEFSSEDQAISRMLHKMGKFLNPLLKEDSPIEEVPFFEGRRKKQTFISGKYHDFIMAACFKTQFDKMMGKYQGVGNG